jgi:N-acetylneuraminic acid mutarotase
MKYETGNTHNSVTISGGLIMKKTTTFALRLFLCALCVIMIGGCARKSAPVTSGTWGAASNAGFGSRAWFTSSVVNDKIYAIGGFGDSTLSTTIDVFDPAANKWSTLVTTGTFTPRGSLASAVLDGKIYVMGGMTGPETPDHMSNKLEIFDPATNSWSTPSTTGTFTRRNNLCACVIDGKIYTMGGFDASNDVNAFEVFDPATNTWSSPKTTGMFNPRGAFTAHVIDGKIYVIGGFNNLAAKGHRVLGEVDIFDPSTNTWSAPATTGTFNARLLHASGVIDGKIYVVGGTQNIRDPLTTNTIQVFDPETNAWSTVKTTGIFTPRAYLSAAVVNNKIYVLGGQDTSRVFNLNEVFTPAADN